GLGTSSLVSIGGVDIFVAIYQVNGSLIKAISMGGKDHEDLAQMAVDPSGNIYITGLFNDTADFDPGINVYNLESNSRRNAYLAKYTNDGNLVYANAIGNISDATSEGVTVAIDLRGRAVLGGQFRGSVDFDPGAGVSSSTATLEDGFIARYDATGKYISHFNFDGYSNTLTLDADDNLYITGVIVDSMDADPGPARKMLYRSLTYDMYLMKLDSSGKFVKAKVFFSKNPYSSMRIVSDMYSHIYIIGWMSDTVYFDPQKPIFNNGINDAYIARFDVDLEHLNSFSIGGTSTDVMQGIHVNTKGGVWITGTFRNKIDMDPGPDSSIFNWYNTGVFFGYYLGTDELVNIQQLQDASMQIYSQGHTVLINNIVPQNRVVYLNIYNMIGQLVAQYENLAHGKTRIELPHIAAGIYYVQVTDGSSYLTRKVLLE
ncbi:MAG: T9SS type A sorting domain-containing protein, partial [Bacteroidia bacterium]